MNFSEPMPPWVRRDKASHFLFAAFWQSRSEYREMLMEVWILASLAGLAAGYPWLRDALRRQAGNAQLRQKRHELESRRQIEADRRRVRHFAYANLLTQALAQLERCTDFRRAANIASHVHELPAGFRQRVFVRFRPRLIRHFAARLNAGEDADLLRESLEDLVVALAIARFEVGYMIRDAQRFVRPIRQERPDDFVTRLQSLQTEHERRLSAIRSTQTIDAEMREQLIEAEETRFRQELLGEQSDVRNAEPQF